MPNFPRRNFLPPAPTRTEDLAPRLLSHTTEATETGVLHRFVFEVSAAIAARLLANSFAPGRTFVSDNAEYLITDGAFALDQDSLGIAKVTLTAASLREAIAAGRRVSAARLGPAPTHVQAPQAPILVTPKSAPARRIIL